MTAKITETQIKRATKIRKYRREDALIREKVKAAIKVVNPEKQSPRKHHSQTTTPPPINHEVTALIQSSLIESSFIQPVLKETVSNTLCVHPDSIETEEAFKIEEIARTERLIVQAEAVATPEAKRLAEQERRKLKELLEKSIQ